MWSVDLQGYSIMAVVEDEKNHRLLSIMIRGFCEVAIWTKDEITLFQLINAALN